MQQTSRRRPFPIHVLVFLAPAILLYTVFMVFPLINSLRLSFFEIGSQNQMSFNGIQNYIKLFTDSNFAPFFWRSICWCKIRSVYYLLLCSLRVESYEISFAQLFSCRLCYRLLSLVLYG